MNEIFFHDASLFFYVKHVWIKKARKIWKININFRGGTCLDWQPEQLVSCNRKKFALNLPVVICITQSLRIVDSSGGWKNLCVQPESLEQVNLLKHVVSRTNVNLYVNFGRIVCHSHSLFCYSLINFRNRLRSNFRQHSSSPLQINRVSFAIQFIYQFGITMKLHFNNWLHRAFLNRHHSSTRRNSISSWTAMKRRRKQVKLIRIRKQFK